MEKMSVEQLSKSYEEVNKKFQDYVKRVSELRVKDQFLNCPVRRVFVSVPMSGRTPSEVETDIEEAKNVFLNFFALNDGEEHFEFVNTFVQDKAPENCMHDPLWYLGNSIKILSTCDIILFARGAMRARGCNVEGHIADEYGIPAIKIDEKRKGDTRDFDYINGNLILFVNKKEETKPKYMTEEGYKEWLKEMEELGE
jgi:hypothetical protein